MKELNLRPEESTAVVQGFGNVGSVACQELHQRGVKVMAVGDRYGAIRNPRGIDVPALALHCAAGKLLRDFPGAERIDPADLLTTPARSWCRPPWTGHQRRTPASCAAASWPRPPTARPRRRPTPS